MIKVAGVGSWVTACGGRTDREGPRGTLDTALSI